MEIAVTRKLKPQFFLQVLSKFKYDAVKQKICDNFPIAVNSRYS